MIFDHTEVQLAFRARLTTLAVATTGSVSLSATATGYARSAGDFDADKLRPGMEVVASGFATPANNGVHVITQVTPLALTILGGLVPEAEGAGRVLAAGLPSRRVFENVAVPGGVAVAEYPYIMERYVPARRGMLCGPYNGGDVEVQGVYEVLWFGVENRGLSAITESADRVVDLFKPGTILTLASGIVVRVRGGMGGDFSSERGQLIPGEAGWVFCTITIPWRARYTN